MRTINETRRRLTPGAILLAVGAMGLGMWLPAQAPPPPPVPPTETLRVEVAVVNIYCTVKDKRGALVTELTADDFTVYEDGKKQEVRYFERETDRPLTLALLVDTSGSQVQVLQTEQEVMGQFLRQILRPSDLALLMSFDVNVDLWQEFTSDAERLESALARLRINAPGPPPGVQGPVPTSGPRGTRLYDAVYLASRQKLAGEVGRKALLVVSDGEDVGSTVKLQEAVEAAHRADTMVYAIGIADPGFYAQQGYAYSGRGVLEKLAKETGGRVIFPSKVEELEEAFKEIADELRSQYTLGYTPTNRAQDGRFRKIQVKVKRDGVRVQARSGYYAPGS
ncbi:MAG: VWA domain-containing protein [Acidobacteria bacterium]|nr:VWA domain-containing protein [Acidobacteriota bacterium]